MGFMASSLCELTNVTVYDLYAMLSSSPSYPYSDVADTPMSKLVCTMNKHKISQKTCKWLLPYTLNPSVGPCAYRNIFSFDECAHSHPSYKPPLPDNVYIYIH